MVTAKEFGIQQFNKPIYQSDLDLGPRTLILKLDLDMVKMFHHTKNEVSRSRHSKVDTLTDKQSENIVLPHTQPVTRNLSES